MAFKKFALDDDTPVTVYKRKRSRGLRLTIAPTGEVRVSIPLWASYKTGVEFARSKRAWINQQQPAQDNLIDGQAIGKAHRLRFVPTDGSKIGSRVRAGEVVVSYPAELMYTDSRVQQAAHAAGVRALRRQAEALLPQRLATLAERHGFHYASVTVKQLRGRWGSCDHHRNIVLNLFLMQLPWNVIDYVILHELTHTEVLRHGPDFWNAMEKVLPNAKSLQRATRNYRPVLQSADVGVA